MKNKGIIKTIIIIGLLCWALYALYPTYKYLTLPAEKRTELEKQGKLVSLINESIHLGLDLQGGIRLVYEVDLPKLVEQLAENKDEKLDEILNRTREKMNISTRGFLTILQEEFEKENIPMNRYWGERGDSESRIINYLDDEAENAMTRSLHKLRNRVDQFGVSEPNLQRLRDRRILIELPGLSDPGMAKELIGRTALLEFKMLAPAEEFTQLIQDIDQKLAREKGVEQTDTVDTTESAQKDTAETETRESEDEVVSVNELFGESEKLEPDTGDVAEDSTVLVDKQIFEEHPFLALLRTGQGGRVVVPVNNVRAVSRIIEREDIQELYPENTELAWGSDTDQIADKSYKRLYLLKEKAELTGKYIKDADVGIGNQMQTAGSALVNFTLDRTGARIIRRVSSANLHKMMAIVLDNKVVSAAEIQSKLGASNQITGIGSMDRAKMIAIVLRVGALDAPIHVVEERRVGPSLGKDSINQGKWSALIGIGLVIIFMIIYYKGSGLIANTALILNLILLMAVLAQFGFTLTLPGVAGIVLTIGMAVDANVLVFERIREELDTGKTVRAAIDAGYSRAFITILDANLTTLLTALVLYQFGTGPVRGFAVTLSIGILASMFTVLVVTRHIFYFVTSRRTLTKLSI